MDGFSDPRLLGTAQWADPDNIDHEYEFRPGHLWLGRSSRNYEKKIGVPIESHAFLCAETQTGKSRSIFVGNLIDWLGSIVAVTKKEDLAEICALKRTQVDIVTGRPAQKTYVFDPSHEARIDDRLRAWFNPLDLIDPKNPIGSAKRLAESLAIFPAGGDGLEWVKKGVKLIAFIIAHIMTCRKYRRSERTLITLFRLVLAGKLEDYLTLREAKRSGDERLAKMKVPSGFMLLLKEMTKNPACDGLIAAYAHSLMKSDQGHEEGLESIRMNALDALDWLLDDNLRRVVSGEGMSEEQRLDPRSLKTDPNGVSVFINSSSSDEELYAGWQKMMFTTIMNVHRDVKGETACGHKTLFCIDEFLSYGRLSKIERGITDIASAGCVLFLSVQKLGPLKEMYKESWETFMSGADVTIWFGLNEFDGTLKHVSGMCGEMHLDLVAHQHGYGEQITKSHGTVMTDGTGGSQGGGRTITNGTGWQESDTKGTSDGSGSSYGSGKTSRAGMILDWMPSKSSNYNKSRNKNKNKSTTRGASGQHSIAETENHQDTWQHSVATQESLAVGTNKNVNFAQQFNKRPLLSIDEARTHLADFTKKTDDPRFPGLALVLMRGEDPFVVRRSFYDMDPYFEGRFTPHPDYKFVPVSEQPMLEFMYTPEHHFDFMLPERVLETGCEFRPYRDAKPGTVIKQGNAFAELLVPIEPNSVFNYKSQIQPWRGSRKYKGSHVPKSAITAPFDLQIMDVERTPDHDQVSRFVIRRLGREIMPAAPCQLKNDQVAEAAKTAIANLYQARKKAEESAERERQYAAAVEKREAEERAMKRFGKVVLFALGFLALLDAL